MSEPTGGGEPRTDASPEPAAKEPAAAEQAPQSQRPAPGRRASAEPKQVGTVEAVRGWVASVVWLVAVVAALFLAIGALVVALEFNLENPIVEFVTETAARLDLGELKTFEAGPSAASQQDALTKSVLVNWGIAAVAYLVVGKILDRVIRP